MKRTRLAYNVNNLTMGLTIVFGLTVNWTIGREAQKYVGTLFGTISVSLSLSISSFLPSSPSFSSLQNWLRQQVLIRYKKTQDKRSWKDISVLPRSRWHHSKMPAQQVRFQGHWCNQRAIRVKVYCRRPCFKIPKSWKLFEVQTV